MMIESSAKTSKMIAAIAIPLHICRSILEVAASMMMRDVEAMSNANVIKLAEQIMGREEVCQPTGAIVTTDDHKVVVGFQKVVLRDKEVDLVAELAGRDGVNIQNILYESQQWLGLILLGSLQKAMANQRRDCEGKCRSRCCGR